jgi:hypothetical protein
MFVDLLLEICKKIGVVLLFAKIVNGGLPGGLKLFDDFLVERFYWPLELMP